MLNAVKAGFLVRGFDQKRGAVGDCNLVGDVKAETQALPVLMRLARCERVEQVVKAPRAGSVARQFPVCLEGYATAVAGEFTITGYA
jgi:hypothetical protein